MCSGELHLSVHKDTSVHVRLTPVLSRVKLVKVENNLEGEARIEDPHVYLTQVNGQAEMLRQSGFRPVEFIRTGSISYLDDVGKYPSYPDISLYCYPNESTGAQATGIVLDCGIGGSRHKLRAQLPPIRRNCSIYASLAVSSADDYRWCFNE